MNVWDDNLQSMDKFYPAGLFLNDHEYGIVTSNSSTYLLGVKVVYVIG